MDICGPRDSRAELSYPKMCIARNFAGPPHPAQGSIWQFYWAVIHRVCSATAPGGLAGSSANIKQQSRHFFINLELMVFGQWLLCSTLTLGVQILLAD